MEEHEGSNNEIDVKILQELQSIRITLVEL